MTVAETPLLQASASEGDYRTSSVQVDEVPLESGAEQHKCINTSADNTCRTRCGSYDTHELSMGCLLGFFLCLLGAVFALARPQAKRKSFLVGLLLGALMLLVGFLGVVVYVWWGSKFADR